MIDALLVLHNDGLEETGVEDGSSESRGKIEPEEEEALEEPVNGEHGADLLGEELHDGEHSENHPVGKPLGVVFLVVRLDSQDARVSRIDEAHCVADKSGKVSEYEIEGL